MSIRPIVPLRAPLSPTAGIVLLLALLVLLALLAPLGNASAGELLLSPLPLQAPSPGGDEEAGGTDDSPLVAGEDGGLGGIVRPALGPIFIAPVIVRGDVDGDGVVDAGDVSRLVHFLAAGGLEPPCLAAADVNGDEALDLVDAAELIDWLFGDGDAPAAPFPGCGRPVQASTLGCLEQSACAGESPVVATDPAIADFSTCDHCGMEFIGVEEAVRLPGGSLEIWFRVPTFGFVGGAAPVVLAADRIADDPDRGRHLFWLAPSGTTTGRVHMWEHGVESASFAAPSLAWTGGAWYHLVFVWGPDGRAIYRDGALVAGTSDRRAFSRSGIFMGLAQPECADIECPRAPIYSFHGAPLGSDEIAARFLDGRPAGFSRELSFGLLPVDADPLEGAGGDDESDPEDGPDAPSRLWDWIDSGEGERWSTFQIAYDAPSEDPDALLDAPCLPANSALDEAEQTVERSKRALADAVEGLRAAFGDAQTAAAELNVRRAHDALRSAENARDSLYSDMLFLEFGSVPICPELVGKKIILVITGDVTVLKFAVVTESAAGKIEIEYLSPRDTERRLAELKAAGKYAVKAGPLATGSAEAFKKIARRYNSKTFRDAGWRLIALHPQAKKLGKGGTLPAIDDAVDRILEEIEPTQLVVHYMGHGGEDHAKIEPYWSVTGHHEINVKARNGPRLKALVPSPTKALSYNPRKIMGKLQDYFRRSGRWPRRAIVIADHCEAAAMMMTLAPTFLDVEMVACEDIRNAYVVLTAFTGFFASHVTPQSFASYETVMRSSTIPGVNAAMRAASLKLYSSCDNSNFYTQEATTGIYRQVLPCSFGYAQPSHFCVPGPSHH